MSYAKQIEEILFDCLYKPDELTSDAPPTNAVLVQGINSKFGFHPERLKSHRQDVLNLLEKIITNEFRTGEGGGGGYSFLSLCTDRQGELWGQHRDCDALLALSIGLNLAKYLLPRDMWYFLPGRVPYVLFHIKAK